MLFRLNVERSGLPRLSAFTSLHSIVSNNRVGTNMLRLGKFQTLYVHVMIGQDTFGQQNLGWPVSLGLIAILPADW